MTEQQYWNARYRSGGNSGYGSYGEQLEKKINWLKDLDVHSIVELGCGDFNFGKTLLTHLNASYEGYDVSDEIIDRNRALFPSHTFKVLGENLPTADLVLCIDVLFHVLEEEAVERIFKLLEGSWTKYLAITAYEYADSNTAPHVKIRPFDYKRFGEPIIREVVEADGSLMFYLYKR